MAIRYDTTFDALECFTDAHAETKSSTEAWLPKNKWPCMDSLKLRSAAFFHGRPKRASIDSTTVSDF